MGVFNLRRFGASRRGTFCPLGVLGPWPPRAGFGANYSASTRGSGGDPVAVPTHEERGGRHA
eukprot:977028-Alexandrium_andersonii.AAC.1